MGQCEGTRSVISIAEDTASVRERSRAFASVRERSRAFASVRERSRTTILCPMRCALRIGLDGGRLGEALWRHAIVIAGERLV